MRRREERIDVMRRLKDATREHHAALEREANIWSACASVDGYRRLLARLFGYYIPLEARLGALPWGELGFDFEARRKGHLLSRDLSLLGVEAHSLSAIPRCADLPEVRDFAQALGCLYVLEGSTLGGQIISRHVEGALGLRGEAGGVSFYHSYGRAVGPMWKAFSAFMIHYATSHGGDEVMLVSAKRTFVTLGRWLSGNMSYEHLGETR